MNFIPNESSSKTGFIGTKQKVLSKSFSVELKRVLEIWHFFGGEKYGASNSNTE